jgi:WD40 repeat protein
MRNKLVGIFLVCCVVLANLLYSQEDPYFVREFKKHKGGVVSVAFSSDGKYLVSGGEDKMVCIYSTEIGDEISSFSNYYVPRGLLATNNEKLIFGSGPDIVIADFSGNLSGTFKGNTTYIQSVDLAVERNKLTAGSYDKTVKIWDINDGQIEIKLEGHTKNVLAVCFSPDEKYLATGSRDQTVKIWNTLTGEILRSMELHSDNILDVEYHPGGNYVLSASLDKSIRLWDVRTGKCVRTYVGHDKGIADIEFLPDGFHFVSCSYDGTIILWETFTGKKVYSFIDHKGPVLSIDVSPDGKYLLSGGMDEKVILWKLSKEIFVNYYFDDVVEKIKSESDLFLPKKKGEDKDSYIIRQEKADNYLNSKVNEYYKKYQEALKSQIIKE